MVPRTACYRGPETLPDHGTVTSEPATCQSTSNTKIKGTDIEVKQRFIVCTRVVFITGITPDKKLRRDSSAATVTDIKRLVRSLANL